MSSLHALIALAILTLAQLPVSSAASGPTGPRDHPGVWEVVHAMPKFDSVHSALLSDGTVMLFGLKGDTYVWDPVTGHWSDLIRPNTNVFCGGMSFLEDGSLFVAGGTEREDRETRIWFGLESTETFDPVSKTWTRRADLLTGPRWYPTQVLLADGRVATFTGIHNNTLNKNAEIYDPDTDTWVVHGAKEMQFYSRAHLMPNGTVFFTGPGNIPFFYDPISGKFQNSAPRNGFNRVGGSSILLDSASGRIMTFGGGIPPNTTSSVEIFDPVTTRWSVGAPMSAIRYDMDSVLLPTGDVLAVGGEFDLARLDPAFAGRVDDEYVPADVAPLPAEMYDVDTGEWIRLATPHTTHPYHATALLLPDASILSTNSLQNRAEIYKPWYFFAGERPAIESAELSIRPGASFEARVGTSDVARAVLVRHGAVTHGLNPDQRLVDLSIVGREGGVLTLTPPANPNVVPPGYYLLFVLDERGVPSEGRTVLVERIVQRGEAWEPSAPASAVPESSLATRGPSSNAGATPAAQAEPPAAETSSATVDALAELESRKTEHTIHAEDAPEAPVVRTVRTPGASAIHAALVVIAIALVRRVRS